jgi:hypothetical protein
MPFAKAAVAGQSPTSTVRSSHLTSPEPRSLPESAFQKLFVQRNQIGKSKNSRREQFIWTAEKKFDRKLPNTKA